MLIMLVQKQICVKNVKRVATKLDISCRGTETEKSRTIINENECMRHARIMCKNVARNNQRAQFGDIINDTTD